MQWYQLNKTNFVTDSRYLTHVYIEYLIFNTITRTKTMCVVYDSFAAFITLQVENVIQSQPTAVN